jgi:cytochrome b561
MNTDSGMNFTRLALVCIHGVVALKHHFVNRDAALKRMLPRAWKLRGSLGFP